jgi:hypothetical protein
MRRGLGPLLGYEAAVGASEMVSTCANIPVLALSVAAAQQQRHLAWPTTPTAAAPALHQHQLQAMCNSSQRTSCEPITVRLLHSLSLLLAAMKQARQSAHHSSGHQQVTQPLPAPVVAGSPGLRFPAGAACLGAAGGAGAAAPAALPPAPAAPLGLPAAAFAACAIWW